MVSKQFSKKPKTWTAEPQKSQNAEYAEYAEDAEFNEFGEFEEFGEFNEFMRVEFEVNCAAVLRVSLSPRLRASAWNFL